MSSLAKLLRTGPLNIPAVFDDAFDALISRLMREWEIPGVSIAIAPLSGAAPVFKAYGLAHGDEAITPKTRFPICSLTKLFTTLTLLRVLKEHSLGPDTPVSDVLPNFKLESEVDGAKVTFAHSVGHAAGIETADVMYTDPAAQKDMIGYLSTLPCSAVPGTTPFYSNYMFDVAALAVEALTGQTFEAVVKENILDPLGMADTSFTGTAGDDVAMGLTPRLEKGELTAGMGISVGVGPDTGLQSLGKMGRGSYGLISTAEDMAKWTASLLSNPFFNAASAPRLEMEDKWHPGGSLLDAPLTYGMGLFQGSHAGVAFLEAYGATAGYRTNMAIIQKLDVGIVVMSNSEEAHELGAMIKFLAIRSHLGMENETVLQAMTTEMAQRRKSECANLPAIAGTTPTLSLGTYVGPGLGRWHLTSASFVTERPECVNIPYLPWLYGTCKPLLTLTGEGSYEGCMQWTNRADGKVYYGCPFSAKEVDGDIWISGFNWGDKAELCVLRKIKG